MNTKDNAAHQALSERIKQLGGYTDVRELSDGTIVGIGPLLFTTAIYIDMDEWGWGRRYCYQSAVDAMTQYQSLQTGDDVPTGWVATRLG